MSLLKASSPSVQLVIRATISLLYSGDVDVEKLKSFDDEYFNGEFSTMVEAEHAKMTDVSKKVKKARKSNKKAALERIPVGDRTAGELKKSSVRELKTYLKMRGYKIPRGGKKADLIKAVLAKEDEEMIIELPDDGETGEAINEPKDTRTDEQKKLEKEGKQVMEEYKKLKRGSEKQAFFVGEGVECKKRSKLYLLEVATKYFKEKYDVDYME